LAETLNHAQSGYTVPFTLVHAGKYVTEDKSKTDATKTKDKPRKNRTQSHKIQQNKTTLVQSLHTSYDTRT